MKRLGTAAALMMVFAGAAHAQGGTADAQCTAATPAGTRDACQKAVDIFKYLAPQLGTTIAGGNTIMGSGGVLGGLPHWTVGVRGTVLMGSMPEFTSANAPDATASAPQSDAYTTSNQVFAFPAVDAAVGVFGGIPLGLTKIGGIDILANAAYVPSVNLDNLTIAPETNLQIGYGARVGLLQESLLVPGIAVSVIQRGLPKTTITSFTSTGSAAGRQDTLQIKDLDLKTTSIRLTVSKSLILFGVAAGVGIDKYKSSTAINTAIYRDVGPLLAQRIGNSTPFVVESEMTRTNYFLDGYLNILLLKIIGEVGMVNGGENTTFNTFDKLPNASRMYGAIGLRVGF